MRRIRQIKQFHFGVRGSTRVIALGDVGAGRTTII
jgi:hypothetical protein